ncbi:MAG: KGK domain-containing protein, partial [Halothece sp.]
PNLNPQQLSHQWLEEGVDCEIMGAYDAKAWRTGKIRVKLNINIR